MILDKINNIVDLKKIPKQDLPQLSDEIRQLILDTISVNGGHLASSLGAVDLTIALHYVFNCPYDKLIWDVGHQSYAHKILTGRKNKFSTIRKQGGLSGFPKMSESEYDCFGVGHSSTSLSAALGMARVRDLEKSTDQNIIAVIGDGALTGGMAYEAINDIGASKTKLIIILNDNKMSISNNVGGMAKYLTKLRISNKYYKFKKSSKDILGNIPFVGGKLVSCADRLKDIVKGIMYNNKMFENLGVKYYGPFDGHNICDLIDILEQVKHIDSPILVHVITNKGKGCDEAEHSPETFHGLSPKTNVDKNHVKEISFSDVFGSTLSDMADENNKIVAITAAMKQGTGLENFESRHPDKFFDVGIAEQHAVTMACGMASMNYKPYFAVYSTFLQRAYDQILHDMCINDLAVTLCIDRAGLVGNDGITHQGVFDISYLSMLPKMTIFAPKDAVELQNILRWSANYKHPLAIRYPKSCKQNYASHEDITLGKWECLQIAKKSPVYIFAVGNRMIDLALSISDVNVINCRFIKPLDENFLDSLASKKIKIITLEEGCKIGGFGEQITQYYVRHSTIKVYNLGIFDEFVSDIDFDVCLKNNDLTKEKILDIIKGE